MELVRGAARFCQMPIFWRFIEATTETEIKSDADAATWLRSECGITTRAALATDESARKRFVCVIQQFNKFNKLDK